MQIRTGNPYRGLSPYGDNSGLGIGGNQVSDSSSGTLLGGAGVGSWHPTVIYLLILLVLEWAVFLFINSVI